MKNSLKSLMLVFFGGIAGWFIRDIASPIDTKITGQTIKDGVAMIALATETTDTTAKSSIKLSPLKLDEKLLASPQLSQFIDLIKQDLGVSDQIKLDVQLLQYAKELLDSPRKGANTESELLKLSQIDSIQLQILPMLIRYYKKINRNEAAIDQLYKLRNLSSFDVDYQLLSQQISELTAKQISYYEHSNQKERLADFYIKLITIEPDNYMLQMQFALFEYARGDYESVMRLLSVLVYHQDLEKDALKLLQKTQYQLSRLESDDVPVRVEKRNGQFIVNAMINDLEPVKLMLDTGASFTILSPEIINSLGIFDSQQFMRFSTANGEINAPIVTLDKIDIQNYILRDVRVGVLDSFPMGTVDGLLGMNFLSKFSFFIDQEHGVLHLSHLETE